MWQNCCSFLACMEVIGLGYQVGSPQYLFMSRFCLSLNVKLSFCSPPKMDLVYNIVYGYSFSISCLGSFHGSNWVACDPASRALAWFAWEIGHRIQTFCCFAYWCNTFKTISGHSWGMYLYAFSSFVIVSSHALLPLLVLRLFNRGSKLEKYRSLLELTV